MAQRGDLTYDNRLGRLLGQPGPAASGGARAPEPVSLATLVDLQKAYVDRVRRNAEQVIDTMGHI